MAGRRAQSASRAPSLPRGSARRRCPYGGGRHLRRPPDRGALLAASLRPPYPGVFPETGGRPGQTSGCPRLSRSRGQQVLRKTKDRQARSRHSPDDGETPGRVLRRRRLGERDGAQGLRGSRARRLSLREPKDSGSGSSRSRRGSAHEPAARHPRAHTGGRGGGRDRHESRGARGGTAGADRCVQRLRRPARVGHREVALFRGAHLAGRHGGRGPRGARLPGLAARRRCRQARLRRSLRGRAAHGISRGSRRQDPVRRVRGNDDHMAGLSPRHQLHPHLDDLRTRPSPVSSISPRFSA